MNDPISQAQMKQPVQTIVSDHASIFPLPNITYIEAIEVIKLCSDEATYHPALPQQFLEKWGIK